MRLLLLNHNVIGRGTYVRVHNLGRELAARGHDVTLVTTSKDARTGFARHDRDGMHVLEAPDLWWGAARTGWDPYNTFQRVRALRGATFDLVHAFDARPAVVLPALRISAHANTPLVMDWADWWGRGGRIQERSGWLVRTMFGPVETWFEEAFRQRAHAATTICSALTERLAALGYPRKRILELPNGCSPAAIECTRSEARRALGIADDEALVVHVGVIMAPDLALLRAAFERARAQLPSLRLIFIGATSRRAYELAGDGITATGFVDAEVLRRWLAAADAGVLPMHDTIGHRGRWPAKLSDYMAAGLPTVVTAVGDVARLVQRTGIGWVADATAEALGAAMLEAVQDPTRDIRGQAARALACGELSWRAVAARLDAHYDRVCNQWKAAA